MRVFPKMMAGLKAHLIFGRNVYIEERSVVGHVQKAIKNIAVHGSLLSPEQRKKPAGN